MKKHTLQLKAMNKALALHAETMIKTNGLSQSDANAVRQNVKYNEPYNNIEAYKSNSVYSTLINSATQTKKNIIDIQTKEE